MVVRDTRGQSLVEFMIFLPFMIGLAILMVRVNTAIQISIVDQKYARAQALFLAYNSPHYPEKGAKRFSMADFGFNQLLLGVSGNLDTNGQSSYVPEATVQSVARDPKSPAALSASNEEQTEPSTTRSNVRVRNTVTLCTQNFQIGLKDPNGPLPIDASLGVNYLKSVLDPKQMASFCASKMKYINGDQAGGI